MYTRPRGVLQNLPRRSNENYQEIDSVYERMVLRKWMNSVRVRGRDLLTNISVGESGDLSSFVPFDIVGWRIEDFCVAERHKATIKDKGGI